MWTRLFFFLVIFFILIHTSAKDIEMSTMLGYGNRKLKSLECVAYQSSPTFEFNYTQSGQYSIKQRN